jgi:tetrahydromethanopterin S-methyltransferase subunit C
MIAMATACDVDPGTGRPILGSLNVCGGALAGLAGLAAGSEAEAAAVGRLVEVLVHEMVHVLVRVGVGGGRVLQGPLQERSSFLCV